MTLAVRDAGGRRGSVTGLLAVGAAGVGALLLVGRGVGYHAPACLLRAETGVPCPVCGLTRLSVHLLQGDIGTAVARDLPGTLFLVLLAAAAAAQALTLVKWRRCAPSRASGRLAFVRPLLLPAVLVTTLVAHWALTAVTGGIIT